MTVIRRLTAVREKLPILWLLMRRDIKVRYADSFLGYLWSFLEPLLMSAIFWFVFTVIVGRNVGEDPYILFLLSGLLPWSWTSSALGDGARALVKDSRLVGSINAPRELWVLRVVGSKAAEYCFALPVLAVIAVLYAHPPSAYILAWPLAFLIQGTFLVGMGLMLAPLGVLVTDTVNFVRLATRLGFYASPIFYGLADVPGQYRGWYELNPMAGVIDLYRATWFPDHFSGWGAVASSATTALVALAIGAVVFSRLERPALKEL